MSITFKDLKIEDLKKDYSTRLGFVFNGPSKSSDKAIEHLCELIIQFRISTEYPEFIVRLDDLNTVFVFRDSFDGPTFFQHAKVATQIGVCNINSLYHFLKNN